MTSVDSNKRFCKADSVTQGSSFSREAPEFTGSPTPDVQCAFYAIERFRSSWMILHVSGVFLKGNKLLRCLGDTLSNVLLIDASLQLLWYDSQGCIRSTSVDIIKQLPFLVATITIQQKWRGLSGLREGSRLPQGYEEFPDKFPPRFQLIGRMTQCSFVLPSLTVPGELATSGSKRRQTKNSRKGRTPETAQTAIPNLFFKISWPEDIRTKEADIIAKAQRLVKTGLEVEYQDCVLKHLPIVHSNGYIPRSSTAIIRTILGIPTEGSRSQYWMLSKKLEPLTAILYDRDLFQRVYWELIRCRLVFC